MVEYKRIPAVNWSTLTHIGRSGLHYRHAADVGTGDTVSFRKGRAMHCLVLQPEKFDEHYRVWDGRRQGKEWDKFAKSAKNAGAEVLTKSEVEVARLQAAAVLRHPAARDVLGRCTHFEHPMRWDEPGIGPAKARIDAFGKDLVVDLKGCRDAAPGPFARSVVSYSYHGQMSWYQRPFRGQIDAYLIAVEWAAPFDVVVYQLPEHVLAAGDELVARRLSRLAACRAADRWPGVSDVPLQLELPDWALGTGAETANEEDTLFGGDDDG